MKKLYKIVAATIILVSTPYAASAADFAPSEIVNDTADVTEFETLAITEMNVDFGSSSADQNVAMVAQTGYTNIGYVNQSGVANFAAVVQDSTGTGSSAAAYVIQTGDTNRAVIIQQPS
jgi:hypothetical protein